MSIDNSKMLVERLRSVNPTRHIKVLVNEAADEIERLQCLLYGPALQGEPRDPNEPAVVHEFHCRLFHGDDLCSCGAERT